MVLLPSICRLEEVKQIQPKNSIIQAPQRVVAESSTSVAETQESTSTDATETETTETSSSLAEATDGSTLTVQAGEGVGQLVARGGISIAELERLNPEKMTTGSWLAHQVM